MKIIVVNGRSIPVTMCPPGRAAGVLPFHIDPIEVVPSADLAGACEDDREVKFDFLDGDAREDTDAFLSRPLMFGFAHEREGGEGVSAHLWDQMAAVDAARDKFAADMLFI